MTVIKKDSKVIAGVFEDVIKQDDRVISFTIADIDREIDSIDTRIARLEEEKTVLEARKTAAEAL